MIEIHLYGKLRGYTRNTEAGRGDVIKISPQSNETIELLVARLEIPVEEIYTIFLNSKLLATRSAMAKWLRYQQTRDNLFDWNLDVPIKSGDRIGLFGRDMAALVI